jgi:signal peptidase I
MKKMMKSNILWIIVGLIVGILISFIISNYSMKEIAPVDFRQHKYDGVLIASASNTPHFSSKDGFLYEPTEQFPVSKRFAIKMKHNDPGMLITDFPIKRNGQSITL